MTRCSHSTTTTHDQKLTTSSNGLVDCLVEYCCATFAFVAEQTKSNKLCLSVRLPVSLSLQNQQRNATNCDDDDDDDDQQENDKMAPRRGR